MRQSASSHRGTSSLFSRGRALALAAAFGVSSIVTPAAWAQEAPPDATPAATPTVAQDASVNVLMEATFEEFPPAPMTMRLLRITLEPGASTPMHTHPGPEFDLIESGALTVQTEGEASVTRADGSEEVSTGEDIVLSAGDSIMFPPEVGMYYVNEGEEPVEMLSAVLLPVGTAYPQSITYSDGQPSADEFVGVSFVVLGDGLVQSMPDAPVTVTVNEVVVPPGTDLPASEGVSMYSAVDGNFSFVVDDGMVQVSRSELESLQPNAVAGEEFVLEQGDAAFFPAGVTATPREGEQTDLALLTVEVTFAEPLEQEAAELTFISDTSATTDETEPEDAGETAETGGIIGQIGTTNAEFINVRSEPSTNADVLDQLMTGIEVEIVGGPVDAEGFTWYEIRVTAEGGVQGWISAEFVDGITVEAEVTQPEPEAEADAPEVDETAATFEVGEVVQLTEDIVRVRAEGNVGANIINTFDTGTQFEITGEPITADGYVWYPVTLVDDPSISGWVTVDFLEAAP